MSLLLIARLESFKLVRHPMIWGLLIIAFLLMTLLFYRICVDYCQLMQDSLSKRHQPISFSLEVIKPFCSWTILIIALISPSFTTTSLCQEYRQKTFYLWAASDHKAGQIIWGKFVCLLAILWIFPFMMLIMISILQTQISLQWGIIFTSLLAVICMGSCFMSFGLFISSLIPHPLLAIGVTFIGNIFWMLLEWLNPFPQTFQFLARALSTLNHTYHLLNGIIYSPDLVFFILFTLFWLILAQKRVQHKMKNL